MIVALAAICLAALQVSTAWASPPVSGDLPDVARRVFVPKGGYAELSRKAHLARRVQERGAAAFAPGQPLLVTGTRAVPTICVEFNNVAGPFPTQDYQRMLFGVETVNSIANYYKAMSLGNLRVSGQVVGWFRAPQDDTYYENGKQGNGPPFGELLEFGLREADKVLDFGQFDNDGKDGLPNSGDDDGKVDMVFFIHPEHGAECDKGTNIWSHSWHYSDSNIGHNGPFVTKDKQLDKNGHPTGKNIAVEDYTIQPALACPPPMASPSNEPKLVDVGVFCHEFGHALGLPDFYDRTPDSEGLGNWCLMAGGSYGGDGKHAERPCRMSAWGVYYLGWANLTTVSSSEEVTLNPVVERNEMLRVMVPNTSDLEYFLLEYRRNGLGPNGALNWDEYLHNSGLAVWHVDERVGSVNNPKWPFANVDQGQNDSPVRLNGFPPPIFKSQRPLIALIQKDRQMNLEGLDPQSKNRGDVGDLYVTGESVVDDPTGRAGTRAYDSSATGIAIRGIKVSPNEIVAKVEVGAQAAPMAAGPVAAAPPAGALPATPLAAGHADRAFESLQQIEGRIRDYLDSEATEHAALRRFAPFVIPLNAEDSRLIRHLNPALAERALSPPVAKTVQRISSQMRTRRVDLNSVATDEFIDQAKRLLSESGDAAACTLRYALKSPDIAEISDLKIKSKFSSLAEDALHRLNEDPRIRELLNAKSEFRMVAHDGASRLQKLQQVVTVAGETLPVWGGAVTLEYDNDDFLVSIKADLARLPDSGVKAPTGALSERQAIEAAANAVGLPASELVIATKGVFVATSHDDPQRPTAQVAYRVQGKPSTDAKSPLSIVVDVDTKKILAVE